MTRQHPLLLLALLWGCGEPDALSGEPGAVHAAGWVAEHGPALRRAGYPIDECTACHDDPATAVSCGDCHEEGPTGCTTCHGRESPPHAAHARFDCATCHPAVRDVWTPGHLEDRPEDVRLTGLAAARGHTPTYAGGRCADTACHAGPGAGTPAPAWAPAALDCGACHGNPPPDHPQDRCDRCHTDPGAGLGHVDGRVDAADWRALPCDGCHGGGGNPAPPRDLAGRSDPAWPGVGAHQAHGAPAAAAPVACDACHVVPAVVEAPGHLDDTPGAEVVLAAGRYEAGRCADTGCHGADAPAWTGDAPCGSCHGLPPAGHPPGDCARCHPTAGPDRTIALPAGHVDGRLDVAALGAGDCATCHDTDRARPRHAHPAHARFDCSTCHLVPAVPLAEGHLDGVAQVAFDGRFDRGTCSDGWCHGEGRPRWDRPDSVDGCGACHGNPPAGHAAGECTQCHPGPESPRHVDRRIDVTAPTACDGCHGDPPDLGAHLAHTRYDCATCHLVPDRLEAPGHLDPPPAEVTLAAGAYVAGGCADTQCHAGPGAATPAPRWEEGPEAAACGACHGLPPPGHPEGRCGTCHAAVVADDPLRIINPARHADGRVDFR